MRFRIEIYVDDIEKSLTFYQTIIGLQLYGRNERCGRFNYDCFSLLVTSTSILGDDHYFNRRGKSEAKGNGVEIIICVPSLQEVYDRCIANNHAIETEIGDYPWGMSGFKIVDPDGYFLRITSETIVQSS